MDRRDAKKKDVLDRIESIEAAIIKAQEYLDSGKHADWNGFRPWFYGKRKDGRELPPHRDWVSNVYLPRQKRALNRAEKAVERLEQEHTRVRANKRVQPTADGRG